MCITIKIPNTIIDLPDLFIAEVMVFFTPTICFSNSLDNNPVASDVLMAHVRSPDLLLPDISTSNVVPLPWKQ